MEEIESVSPGDIMTALHGRMTVPHGGIFIPCISVSFPSRVSLEWSEHWRLSREGISKRTFLPRAYSILWSHESE
jgi:hypothetical protein